ncbi:MAG: hypothetical protein ACOYK6_08645 [Chthoniobacterales bacterium]
MRTSAYHSREWSDIGSSSIAGYTAGLRSSFLTMHRLQNFLKRSNGGVYPTDFPSGRVLALQRL